MTTRTVPFHLAAQVSVLLPVLLDEDGTAHNLTGAGTVTLYCKRDNAATQESATVGVTPVAGNGPGTLSVYNAPLGQLVLLVDDAYFTPGVPVPSIVNVDGKDYPQDGCILLAPEAL